MRVQGLCCLYLLTDAIVVVNYNFIGDIMPAFIDKTGNTYGKLKVIRLADSKRGRDLLWVCQCSCGNVIETTGGRLQSGNTKSCGCNKTEVLLKRNTKHSLSKTSEYMSWKDMKKRCYNKANKRYPNYSAKGIIVCDEWKNDFLAFLNYMGNKPDDGNCWTVGRIDNNKSYEPGNVRWELLDQQARNHSKQSNNTSGITGVMFRVKVVNGREYSSWVAAWNELNGKKKTKEFSVNKFGFDAAKQMAVDYRNKAIEDLNNKGAGYEPSHGTTKEG